MSAGLSLRRLLGRGNAATVCVPHPFNPLSNFAYFAPGAADVRIYQDGILNYYDAVNPLNRRSVLLAQRIKAAALLLRYTPYDGHLSGIEARNASVGYFTHPEHVARPASFAKVTRIGFDAAVIAGARRRSGEPCTLFLDQPIEQTLPRETARSLRLSAQVFAESLGRPIVYKPHYTQRQPFAARPGWRSVSVEEATLPAEEVVANRPVATVVSFYSSALMNVRLAMPDVQCIAVGASAVNITINDTQATLADLLSKFGVQTLEPVDTSHEAEVRRLGSTPWPMDS